MLSSELIIQQLISGCNCGSIREISEPTYERVPVCSLLEKRLQQITEYSQSEFDAE